MARTDDDSWDITESVGATALGVAWARAQEASTSCPLFTDSYAQRFVDAARPEDAEPLVERVRAALGAQGGRFGARMSIDLVNDGPVTLVIDV